MLWIWFRAAHRGRRLANFTAGTSFHREFSCGMDGIERLDGIDWPVSLQQVTMAEHIIFVRYGYMDMPFDEFLWPCGRQRQERKS